MDSSNLQLTVFRLGHYMDEAPDLVERRFKEKLRRVVDEGRVEHRHDIEQLAGRFDREHREVVDEGRAEHRQHIDRLDREHREVVNEVRAEHLADSIRIQSSIFSIQNRLVSHTERTVVFNDVTEGYEVVTPRHLAGDVLLTVIEKETLKSHGLGYLSQLLDPPQNLPSDVDALRLKAFNILSPQQQRLCRGLLDVQESDGRRNFLHHPPPDRDTAMDRVGDFLDDEDQKTLRKFLKTDPKRLPSRRERTRVADPDLFLFAREDRMMITWSVGLIAFPIGRGVGLSRCAEVLLSMRANEARPTLKYLISRVGPIFSIARAYNWGGKARLLEAGCHHRGIGNATLWDSWMLARDADNSLLTGARNCRNAVGSCGRTPTSAVGSAARMHPDMVTEVRVDLMKRSPRSKITERAMDEPHLVLKYVARWSLDPTWSVLEPLRYSERNTGRSTITTSTCPRQLYGASMSYCNNSTCRNHHDTPGAKAEAPGIQVPPRHVHRTTKVCRGDPWVNRETPANAVANMPSDGMMHAVDLPRPRDEENTKTLDTQGRPARTWSQAGSKLTTMLPLLHPPLPLSAPGPTRSSPLSARGPTCPSSLSTPYPIRSSSLSAVIDQTKIREFHSGIKVTLEANCTSNLLRPSVREETAAWVNTARLLCSQLICIVGIDGAVVDDNETNAARFRCGLGPLPPMRWEQNDRGSEAHSILITAFSVSPRASAAPCTRLSKIGYLGKRFNRDNAYTVRPRPRAALRVTVPPITPFGMVINLIAANAPDSGHPYLGAIRDFVRHERSWNEQPAILGCGHEFDVAAWWDREPNLEDELPDASDYGAVDEYGRW
ncbi:hypothetical protein B0H14DRAFT_3642249 [Mycena olivaceomarginata]|nr:hypothetical protein B0H14DRAFT_3642249 [Mycena olivaceomarginata]